MLWLWEQCAKGMLSNTSHSWLESVQLQPFNVQIYTKHLLTCATDRTSVWESDGFTSSSPISAVVEGRKEPRQHFWSRTHRGSWRKIARERGPGVCVWGWWSTAGRLTIRLTTSWIPFPFQSFISSQPDADVKPLLERADVCAPIGCAQRRSGGWRFCCYKQLMLGWGGHEHGAAEELLKVHGYPVIGAMPADSVPSSTGD